MTLTDRLRHMLIHGNDDPDAVLDAINVLGEVEALVEARNADHAGRTECFEAIDPHITELAERIR